MRRDARGIDGRDQDYAIADLLRVAAIAADHAEHLQASLLCLLEPGDNVRADVFFQIAAADGKNEQRVFAVELASFEPDRKSVV